MLILSLQKKDPMQATELMSVSPTPSVAGKGPDPRACAIDELPMEFSPAGCNYFVNVAVRLVRLLLASTSPADDSSDSDIEPDT